MSADTKTVLFFPLNSPGHINSSLAIADQLKKDHGYRIVFLLLGPMIGNSILNHGHELLIIKEANEFEDYEISDDEDLSKPLDEQIKLNQGRQKKKFPGVFKWPQIITRYQYVLRKDPVTACVESFDSMQKSMSAELVDNYDSYVAKIDSLAPDMVVVDAYYVPPCIVNIKVPWVRLYTANPMSITRPKLPGNVRPPPMTGFRLMTKEARAKLRQDNPEKWQSMLDEWQEATTRIVDSIKNADGTLFKFLEEHGCPPLEPGQQAHDSPHLNLYLFPKELDYDQDDDILEYPPRWFRCDSLIRNSDKPALIDETRIWGEKLKQAMDNKKEMIFFSLGSIASGDVCLMKRFVEMFKHDKQRLYVISKGVNGDKYELDPDNMIGGNYIPQTVLLQHADLAIIHGGNNSVTECLYYGVPTIVMPLFGDQSDNAQRIEDLGLGKRLNAYDCTRQELIESIDGILNDNKLVERVHKIGQRMRSQDDAGKISFMLKKLIEEGHLDQSFIEECRQKNLDEIKA